MMSLLSPSSSNIFLYDRGPNKGQYPAGQNRRDYKAAFKTKNTQVYIPPGLVGTQTSGIDRRHELNNDEITEILRSEVKRKEVLDQFTAGGRQTVDQTNNEIQVISAYLPAQMDDAALRQSSNKPWKNLAQRILKIRPTCGCGNEKVKGLADGGRKIDCGKITSVIFSSSPLSSRAISAHNKLRRQAGILLRP